MCVLCCVYTVFMYLRHYSISMTWHRVETQHPPGIEDVIPKTVTPCFNLSQEKIVGHLCANCVQQKS